MDWRLRLPGTVTDVRADEWRHQLAKICSGPAILEFLCRAIDGVRYVCTNTQPNPPPPGRAATATYYADEAGLISKFNSGDGVGIVSEWRWWQVNLLA